MIFGLMIAVGTSMTITGGIMEHHDKKTNKKKEEVSKKTIKEQIDDLVKTNDLDEDEFKDLKDLLKAAGIE